MTRTVFHCTPRHVIHYAVSDRRGDTHLERFRGQHDFLSFLVYGSRISRWDELEEPWRSHLSRTHIATAPQVTRPYPGLVATTAAREPSGVVCVWPRRRDYLERLALPAWFVDKLLEPGEGIRWQGTKDHYVDPEALYVPALEAREGGD